jgi:glycerophosphoryl diester phosphodiesterase
MPLTVCHRGASALAPENSLEAFRVAMQHGIHISELDVHLGPNGRLLVTHDPPQPGVDYPALEDVFDLVRGRMGLYVELKSEGTAEAFGALLRSGLGDGVRLISGSFHLPLVAELRRSAPEVPRSILFAPGWSVAAMVDACREVEATYAHPCFRPITRGTVDNLHAAGLSVMTPHTNDAQEAEHFAALGVDVIASDDPTILSLWARTAADRYTLPSGNGPGTGGVEVYSNASHD